MKGGKEIRKEGNGTGGEMKERGGEKGRKRKERRGIRDTPIFSWIDAYGRPSTCIYDVVVKKFTFSISSSDEFLVIVSC